MTRKRIAVVPQLDGYDCGPACLLSILSFYGADYSRNAIRKLCRTDRIGCTLGALAAAAESLGLKAKTVKTPYEGLLLTNGSPCIAHMNGGHYVVVYRATKKRVYVVDPSVGKIRFSKREFEEAWLKDAAVRRGVLLLLEYTGALGLRANTSDKYARFRLLKPYTKDLRSSLPILALTTAVVMLAQVALPVLSGALIDGVARTQTPQLLTMIVASQLVFQFSRVTAQLLQSAAVTYIGVRCDLLLVSRFLEKLTRLPFGFFEDRTSGELMQRISDQKAIEQFVTSSAGRVMTSFVSLLIFSIVLLLYSANLFAVFWGGAALYVTYNVAFFRYQANLNYKSFRLSSAKYSATMEMLAGMQELKLNGAEGTKLLAWERVQTALSRVQLRSRILFLFQGSGGGLLSEFTNILLMLLSVRQVMTGALSLGSMLSVQYIIGQMMVPLSQIVTLMLEAQEASLSLSRTYQVSSLEDEEADTASEPVAGGDITFQNVSFSYGGTRTSDVLNDISLTIPYGKTTAIVGRSGSGKSTLLKLLLRFYEPTNGNILLNGTFLAKISHANWRARCGSVMQDGVIFSDTIADNISLGAAHIDKDKLYAAGAVAQIHDLILGLPLKYDTVIGRDGTGLSRGQLQRILIARAIYRDPQYLFLDEATSALDAATERAFTDSLIQQLKRRTAVIIAHRMSTIVAADQIIVLGEGRVLESGTHAELYGKKAAYYELLRNQFVTEEVPESVERPAYA